MKPSMARILPIVLLVTCSTVEVHAFHLQSYSSGTTPRVSSGYDRLSNIVATTYDEHDNRNAVGNRQFPRLFAAATSNGNFGEKPGRIRCLIRRMTSFFKLSNRLSFRFRTLIAAFAIFFAINFSVLPAWAGSSGRAGGSFGRSDRFRSAPITRTLRPTNSGGTTSAPSYRTIRAPIRSSPIRDRSYRNYHQANGQQVEGEGVAILSNADGSTTIVRKVNTHPYASSRFSVSDVVFFSGVTAVVANGVVKGRANRDKYDDDDALKYPLGPGISVWRLTACLDVPNTKDPESVVRRLQRLAERTSTETRKGMQTILAETSLELLRQLEKGSISSVESQYDHYRSSDQAEVRAQRQYNRISTKQRSKFDKESWSSYNGSIVKDDSEEAGLASEGTTAGSTSSLALVQIHVVIEGNAMNPFGVRQIETRKSLQEALLQLSGDLNSIEDCVLAGEVLWAPQQLGGQQNEVMTEEDVYASHPMLWPVDYSMKM